MFKYLKSFFTIRTLFNSRPAPIEAPGSVILVILFGVFLILALLSKIWQKKNKNDRLLYLAYQKFFYLFLTIGLIGLVYTWLAYEGIPFLSAKILLLVLILTFLVWLFIAVKYMLVTVPKIKKERKKREEFEKYLP
jgi:small-conductance mechanosensitive channel